MRRATRLGLPLAFLVLGVVALRGPGTIEWHTELAPALARAHESGRLVLVHVSSPELPLCVEMDAMTFGDSRVRVVVAGGFVPLRIDPREDAELVEELCLERGNLLTAVADDQGRVLALSRGPAGPDELVDFLEHAREHREEWSTLGGIALVDLLVHLSHPRAAEALCREVLADEATGSAPLEARERLARILVERGECRAARDELAGLRAVDPDGTYPRPDRIALTEAIACLVERRPKGALRATEEASERWPGRDEADRWRLVRATALHHVGRDDDALAELDGLLAGYARVEILESIRELDAHIRFPPLEHTH